MERGIIFKQQLARTDLGNGASIERYAVRLKGMTFRDILELGIFPEGYTEKDYGDRHFKGGMGNLIEERFFGYKANSDERPDFPEAGVELKATCYDVKRNGDYSAGERLVLTMIPYDRAVSDSLYRSHLWQKSRLILLIVYERNRDIDTYDQRIRYVDLFTPPHEDLKIIEEDYATIVGYLKSGRADELSEGLTTYLGAATKGSTAAKSWTTQFYPAVDKEGSQTYRLAKRRAFSYKRQYMDYVLHHYLMHEEDASESIISPDEQGSEGFESTIEHLIGRYAGKTDEQLAFELDIPYSKNKAQWTSLAYRMLGIKNNRAKEFIKAGISVRVTRIEDNGKIRESLSFAPFEFKELVKETWEESEFRTYLEETRFFFVVFQKQGEHYVLKGCRFWNMPVADIEGAAKRCWTNTQDIIRNGVHFTIKRRANGSFTVSNNLPCMSDNPICHVRPHATKSAYLLHDGTSKGDITRDASELPDGQWMTRQSFWFNNSYLKQIVASVGATE